MPKIPYEVFEYNLAWNDAEEIVKHYNKHCGNIESEAHQSPKRLVEYRLRRLGIDIIIN